MSHLALSYNNPSLVVGRMPLEAEQSVLCVANVLIMVMAAPAGAGRSNYLYRSVRPRSVRRFVALLRHAPGFNVFPHK